MIPPSTASRLRLWLLVMGLLVLVGMLGWHAFLLFLTLTDYIPLLPPGWGVLLALPSIGTTVLLLLIGFAARRLVQGSSATFAIFVSLEALGLVLYLVAYALLAGQIGSTTPAMLDLFNALVSAGAMANTGGLFALLLIVLPGMPPVREAPPRPP